MSELTMRMVRVVKSSLQSRINGITRSLASFRVRRLTEHAILRMGLPWSQVSRDLWTAVAPAQHNFAVVLELAAGEKHIFMSAAANFHIDEFVHRDLLWALLEENSQCVYGSFSLLATRFGHQIIHACVCDARRFDAGDIAEIGQRLVHQMQRMIESLHARDLT